MDSEKDFLIIKWDVDSFERAYNERLCDFADVVSIPSIYDVHCSSKKEKKSRINESLRCLDHERPLSSYKKIIVFEDMNITWVLRRFVSNRKNICLWYWNLIDLGFKDRIKLQLIKRICSAWTFDEKQAKELGIRHNPQFYIGKPLPAIDSGEDYDQDLFFVGLNKGRKEILKRISDICAQNGLNAKIVIAGEKDSNGNITGPMDYSDVIGCIRKSRAILEIGREDQVGLTVRSLEALYFNKSLITNNKQIYEKKYFGPENSYIYDPGDPEGLAEFIRSSKPYYSSEAYEYYSVKAWLGRF